MKNIISTFASFITLSWLLFSLSIAAIVLMASWDHNPQEEFHSDVEIYWSEWLPLGISGFLMTGGFIPLFLLLRSFFKRNKEKT